MSASEARSEIVMELAEEFLERYRNGERPGLKEYADRHPELAGEIREVFPAMAMMENIAIQDDSLVGEETEAQGSEKCGARALEQLGDYRIIREIGHGGMGVVYAAEQVSLGRQVALKVLSSQMLRDSKQRRRFEREAKAAAKLHHTNIVPVFGVGEHEGSAYYVMQYIQGLGLDQVIEELQRMRPGGKGSVDAPPVPRSAATRGDLSAADMAHSLLVGRFNRANDDKTPAGTEIAATLAMTPSGGHAFAINDRTDGGPPLARVTKKHSPSVSVSRSSVVLPGASSDGEASRSGPATYWQSVARIGVQVADGLEYAHRQGVLHRDIKPSNLLLDSRGTVWVTDFGLAKTEDHQNLTHTGDILGTLRYMPPEAFEGKYDVRGDVYALGLTLYELLALRPAFDDKDRHRLVKRVMHETPDKLGQLNREIPRDLVTIVHKAIAREPDHRYLDAEAMGKDLSRFLEGRPILARRVSATERTWRWCRRNPVIAGMLVMLVVALGGVFGLWLRSERLLTLARRQAVGLQLDQAIVLCEQGYIDRGLLAMAGELKEYGTSPPAEQHAIRANLASWSAKLIVPETLATRIVTGRGVPGSQGNLWVTVDEDGKPQLWDLATGKQAGKGFEPIGSLRPAPPGATPPKPALWFSDDGKIVIGRGGDGWCRVWNLDTGRLLGPPIDAGTASDFELSEDYRLLATILDKDVKRWDVATGRSLTAAWRPELDPGALIVAFYPHRVVTRDKSGAYRLFDLDSGQMIGRPMPSAAMSQSYEVKDRKALCLWEDTDQERWIQGWSVETGEALGPRWSAKGKRGELRHAQIGSNLVFVVRDTIVIRDLATGKQQGEAIQTSGVVKALRVLPEQRVYVITDKERQIWDLSTRRTIGRELKIDSQSDLWAISADARRVVLMRLYQTTSEYNAVLEIWDVPTANRLLTLGAERKIDLGTVVLDPSGLSLTYMSKDHTLNRCELSRSSTDHPLLDDAGVSALVASTKPVTLRYHLRSGNQELTILDVMDNETLSPAGPSLHMDAPAKVYICSPLNDLILTGCDDGSARLWSPITAAPVGIVMRHPQAVTSASFTSDGQIIATGSGRTARLWDVDLCRPIGPPMEHPAEIKSLYFSTDGRWLLVKCHQKGAYRWPVPSPMEGDADRVLARVQEMIR